MAISTTRVEISIKTLLIITLILASFWILNKLQNIVLIVIVSFILMSALDTVVARLQRLKIPRIISIISLYILIWILISGLLAGLVPGLVDQTTIFFKKIPASLSGIEFVNKHQKEINDQLLGGLSSISQNFIQVLTTFFGNILNIASSIVISFYFLIYRPQLQKQLSALLGETRATRTVEIIEKIQTKLGSWVRGELFLMLVVGSLTYIGLLALNIDTALPLAILAGILEILPNIGPTLSAIPAILIALTIHPLTAVATGSLYFLVQLFENNLLVPKVMQKAVGVNPIISILSLMIGFKLSGPSGAILAIPVVITVHTLLFELYFKSKSIAS